jgi:hypothetical protein
VAAIDGQDRAGDGAGRRRGEEGVGGGDLVDGGAPAERDIDPQRRTVEPTILADSDGHRTCG